MERIIKKIGKIILKPEMMILPGQLAFFIILAIFPLLTVIGYVGSNIELFSNYFTMIINGFMPKEFSNIILPFLNDSKITTNILIFIILGFYLMSNGTNALIVTSNELFKIKQSTFWQRRFKAFLMILVLMGLFIFIVLGLAYGNIIIKWLITLPIINEISPKLLFIYYLIKWPLAFICIFLIIKFIYSLAPDENIPSKIMNKGALFTTISWMIITLIYSVYISNFANYSVFYGSLSAIIVMMIWIYMLSYILVMGIAINVTEYENINEITNNKNQ